MLVRWTIAAALFCSATCAEADTLKALSRLQMQPRAVYEFRTTGRTYRAEVVDPRTGECLMARIARRPEFQPAAEGVSIRRRPGAWIRAWRS